MNKRLLLLILAVLQLYGFAKAEKQDYVRVAKEINENYESKLFTLKPSLQRHYAERMYRTTGDRKYIFPLIADLLITAIELEQDLNHLLDSSYIKERSKLLLDEFNDNTNKGRNRKKFFKNNPFWLNELRILYNTNKLFSYGLNKRYFDNLCKKSINHLKEVNFRKILLDSALIRVYSPQAINYVYNLYYLDIADLRSEYSSTFRRVFTDKNDQNLLKWEFKNKIYGLTHFIIAASDYYQKPVSLKEYEWIVNYFRDNIDTILKKTTADIIAEVGICLELTNLNEDSVLALCKEKLVLQYNKTEKMIPSPRGNTDLSLGEHRNVLVAMLFGWEGRFYKTSELYKSDEFKKTFDFLKLNKK